MSAYVFPCPISTSIVTVQLLYRGMCQKRRVQALVKKVESGDYDHYRLYFEDSLKLQKGDKRSFGLRVTFSRQLMLAFLKLHERVGELTPM